MTRSFPRASVPNLVELGHFRGKPGNGLSALEWMHPYIISISKMEFLSALSSLAAYETPPQSAEDHP